MYRAEVVEKDTVRGTLRLVVEFTNGTDLFREVFSFSNPTKEVVDEAIDEVLKRADKAETFDVSAMSKHPVKETVEAEFQDRKIAEKAEREKPKEVAETPKEAPVEAAPVEPVKGKE